MIAAQRAGLTRLDVPLVLGTLVTADPDRAPVAGFFIHLIAGQGVGLGSAATFALVHRDTWWRGALPGALHVSVALTVLLPLPPGVHPRTASHRAGPASTAVLEPPGLFAAGSADQQPWAAGGDTRTAALVSGDGAIDWLCVRRFDGEPRFGRLVGYPPAGTARPGPRRSSSGAVAVPPGLRVVGVACEQRQSERDGGKSSASSHAKRREENHGTEQFRRS